MSGDTAYYIYDNLIPEPPSSSADATDGGDSRRCSVETSASSASASTAARFDLRERRKESARRWWRSRPGERVLVWVAGAVLLVFLATALILASVANSRVSQARAELEDLRRGVEMLRAKEETTTSSE